MDMQIHIAYEENKVFTLASTHNSIYLNLHISNRGTGYREIYNKKNKSDQQEYWSYDTQVVMTGVFTSSLCKSIQCVYTHTYFMFTTMLQDCAYAIRLLALSFFTHRHVTPCSLLGPGFLKDNVANINFVKTILYFPRHFTVLISSLSHVLFYDGGPDLIYSHSGSITKYMYYINGCR